MQTGKKDYAPGAARSGAGLGRGDPRLVCAGGFSPSMGSTVIWQLEFLALFGVGGRLHARSASALAKKLRDELLGEPVLVLL